MVVHELEFSAFGSRARLLIAGVDDALAGQAFQEIERVWAEVGREWYAHGADGALARANLRLAAGEPAELGPDLARITERALELRRATGGLFDPAAGSAVRTWGFGRAEDLPDHPPDSVSLAMARSSFGAELGVIGSVAYPSRPLVLDLGGIAKGSALMLAASRLQDLGIRHALISAGDSSILVLGRHGARAWRVAIDNPHGQGVLASIDLEPGESLAVSGNYERFFIHEGQHLHHVIDPRTGQPARDIAMAAVISPDAELADAASTALLIGGRSLFRTLVGSLSLDHALLVTESGDLIVSPALERRLERH